MVKGNVAFFEKLTPELEPDDEDNKTAFIIAFGACAFSG